MRKLLLLIPFLFASLMSDGQVLLNESFDGLTFPPTGWVRNGTGTNSFGTGGILWQRVTNGGFNYTPTPNTHTGAGMAGYNSFYINAGGTSQLITPALNFTAAGSKVLSFWVYQEQDFSSDNIDILINTAANVTGATTIANITPVYLPTTTGWVQYTYTLSPTFNTATNYIIFRANSQYGVDLFLDDVNVTNLVPCSGTPTAGTAYATPNPVCPNQPFVLTDTAFTVGSGVTYLWQSSTSPTGPWTNIAGATNSVYTVAAGISTPTYYRFYDSCANSHFIATSNVITETLLPGSSCYCTPIYSNGCTFSDDINTISLVAANATGFSQLNTGCSNGAYIYYNSLPAFTVNPGCTYNGTINSDFSSESVRIWIDFNDDGVFSNAEQVGTISNLASPPAVTTYSITLPATATPGVHRMRYRLGYFVTASTIDPCSSISYGETHDYNVTVATASTGAPTVINNAPFCQPGTLIISASTSACNPTYTLSSAPAGSGVITPITNTTGIFTIPNATPAMNGTYTVTYTSGGVTSPVSSTNVIVYPTPTLTLGPIAGPTTCATATGTIQINGLLSGSNYTVKYRKGTITQTLLVTSTVAGNYVITGLSQGTYDSIRVITPNGCISNNVGPVTLVDPNPPAAPTLTANYPLCTGTSLILTSTSNPAYPPGTNYVFGGPSTLTGGGTSNTATHANFVAANNGNYTAYVVVNNCTSPTTTLAVAVTPASAAPAITNVSYCQNSFASPLIGSITGTNITIYDSAAGGNILPNTYVPLTNVAGTQVYYITQSNPCPGPRAALTVTIKPTPLAPTVINPISFCQYEVTGALTAQGQNLLWYTTATGGTGTTTAPVPVTTIPGTYNFYVSQTVAGCEGPRAIISVTIKPKPAPPAVQPIISLCQNDPPTPLTATGQNLLWYTVPVGGVGVPTAPVPNVGYEDSFFYYISQRVNGCESDRSQIKVIVNYRPNGIIVASLPWVCAEQTDTFRYFGNARPDAIYNWHTPNPNTAIISGDNSPGPLVVQFNKDGDQLISLQIDNKGCLSPVITTSVNVRILPIVTFASSKADICTDQVVNVAINHITDNISNYNWTGFDGATVAYGTYNGGPFGLSWSQAGNHIVSLIVTSNECNSHPANDTINVHAYADATIHYAGETLDICSSDSVRLSVTPGVDPATYLWTPAPYFYNRSDSTPTVWVTPKYSGEVHVFVKSIYGCNAQDSVAFTTKPCCGVTFPTAFAPSDRNNPRNQIFHPITIGNHEVKSFRVINRWGQVVFESTDERRGWDGSFNGAPQDMGMYYWYFSYKCSDGQDLTEKGEVLLMR